MANAPKKVNRSWVPERTPFDRERKADDFDYNCRAWRNTRKRKLEKNPLCEQCEAQGIVTPATVVDHIIRVKDGGNGFDEANLQSLCKPHHDSKSGRERHAGGMG